MSFIRYTASADNTIVNAYQPNLSTRGTGSNAGEADIVEVFSVYGRQTPYSSNSAGITLASQELSRVLIQFPTTAISTDRSAGAIPASGSVSFFLRMFNAPHSRTVPREYKLNVVAVSQSWQEGYGLDLEGYKDLVKNNSGSNWIQAQKGTNWTYVGGDYLTSSTDSTDYRYEQTFKTGLEDLQLDVTPMVERWLAGDVENNGMGVHLNKRYEAYYSSSNGLNTGSIINNTGGAEQSYYTKRFFARGSQYFFKRPVLEARWDSCRRDDRANFYFSSSRMPAADNLNTIYFYNYVRGRLTNLPNVGTGEVLVSLYSGSANNTVPSGSKLSLYDSNTNITGGWVSTGIYSCSIGIVSSSTTTLYDVWHSGGVEYFTGSISPKFISTGMTDMQPSYVIAMRNLKDRYNEKEKVRFSMYARHKNWKPNIYTVANASPETLPIVSASYRVYRLLDNYPAVSYGTASRNHTGLSYDVSGNYFDFDMAVLDPGYAYAFKFSIYDETQSSWIEQDETFKFRLEEK